MMSQAISRLRSVSTSLIIACVSLAFSGSQAKAQSNVTGDTWSVGASSGDNASVGVAATVDVPPPPASSPTVVQHSTNSVPSTQIPQAAPGPVQPTPAAPAGAAAPSNADYEDADPSALEAFRGDLDPYGRWIDDSRYGRVWVPDSSYVGSDFAPYVSNGHWALDGESNWVWVSDYPFGWAVFHYGRWVWIVSVGWSWVPGRRYAPAWVVWRVPTDDYAYVGWAPAPPTYVWFGTGVYWLGYYPPLPFVFCPSSYVFYPHFGAYLVRDRYFAGTLVRHSVWYSTAPIYGRGYASPTMGRARIPASAVPSHRVSADPRAAAMARPSANPNIANRSSAPAGVAGGRFGARPANVIPGANRPSTTIGSGRYGSAPAFRSSSPSATPSFRSNSTAGGYGSFSTRPRATVERPSYPNRQVQSLGSMPSGSYASPRSTSPAASPRYSSPSVYSSPRFSSPSTSYSSPRFSSPSSSYSAPRAASPSYSAPARSYSAPSQSFSAPSHSFSAPSHSFSGGGGGFRGGGGGFRSGGGGRHR